MRRQLNLKEFKDSIKKYKAVVEADLINLDFTDLKLDICRFEYCYFENCKFDNTSLEAAYFYLNRIAYCDFELAKLDYSQFYNCVFINSSINFAAYLGNVQARSSFIYDKKYKYTNLKEATV